MNIDSTNIRRFIIVMLVFLIHSNLFSQDLHFDVVSSKSASKDAGVIVMYMDKDNNSTDNSTHNEKDIIGKVHFQSLPLTSTYYVAHTLYITPNYRRQGHSKTLMNYLCQHLSVQGGEYLYIQPGPFEMGYNYQGSEEDYLEKLTSITNIYRKCGFQPASAISQNVAWAVYKVLQLKQDPSYLMVKKLGISSL